MGLAHFDQPVRRDKNPLDKWVYDYLPLAHAQIWWATEKRPAAGAVFLTAWHCADEAVEKVRQRFPDIEPNPALLRQYADSRTTIAFYVKATIRMDPKVPISDWLYVDKFIESTPGYHEELWADEAIHEAPTVGLIRYGGFVRELAQLQDRRDVDELIVKPLLTLADLASRPSA